MADGNSFERSARTDKSKKDRPPSVTIHAAAEESYEYLDRQPEFKEGKGGTDTAPELEVIDLEVEKDPVELPRTIITPAFTLTESATLPEVAAALRGHRGAIDKARYSGETLIRDLTKLGKKVENLPHREQGSLEEVRDRIRAFEGNFGEEITNLINRLGKHAYEEDSNIEARHFRAFLDTLRVIRENLGDVMYETEVRVGNKGLIRSSPHLKQVRFGIIEAEKFRKKAFEKTELPLSKENQERPNRVTDAELGEEARVSLQKLRTNVSELLAIGDGIERTDASLKAMQGKLERVRLAIDAIEQFQHEWQDAKNIAHFHTIVKGIPALPEAAADTLYKRFDRRVFNRLTKWDDEAEERVPNATRVITEEERDRFFAETVEMKDRLTRLAGAYQRVIDASKEVVI